MNNRSDDKRYQILETAPGWGQRLVKVRVYRGMTQAQLVKATELAPATVYRHEKGGAPRAGMIDVYVKVLDVDRDYLLRGEPYGKPPWGQDEQPSEPKGPAHAELWELYFSNDMGRDTPADLRPRLLAFPFESLGIAVPTLSFAHQIRLIAQAAAETHRT